MINIHSATPINHHRCRRLPLSTVLATLTMKEPDDAIDDAAATADGRIDIISRTTTATPPWRRRLRARALSMLFIMISVAVVCNVLVLDNVEEGELDEDRDGCNDIVTTMNRCIHIIT